MTAVSQVKCFALHNEVEAFISKFLREVNYADMTARADWPVAERFVLGDKADFHLVPSLFTLRFQSNLTIISG